MNQSPSPSRNLPLPLPLPLPMLHIQVSMQKRSRCCIRYTTFSKRPVGVQVRLIFLVDHTATLVALIHLCSGDLPAACYVYDKLVAVREEWHSILEFCADPAHLS